MTNYYFSFHRRTKIVILGLVLCCFAGQNSFSQCFTAVIKTKDTHCAGLCDGSATATITGGSGSFSYAWGPSGITAATAKNLCAGTYSVTISDAVNTTCTTVLSYTITEPPAVVVTPASTGTTCGDANGSVSATATGGSGTFNYTWSSGGNAQTVNKLAAGTYTVSVHDANDCLVISTAVITNAGTRPTAVITSTPITCFGSCDGSAHISATGGTGVYSYSWSSTANAQTISSLCAGSYTVTITETASGCSATASAIFTQPTALVTTVTPTNAFCGQSNGNIVVSASGGTVPYTYSWSNGATSATVNNLGANTYTVTVKDQSFCLSTKTATITNTSGPTINTLAGSPILCNGSSGNSTVSITGGSANYTYSWSNGASSATSALSNQQIGLVAGNYTVTVTDATGCQAISSITLTQPQALSAVTGITNSGCGLSNGSAFASVSGGTAAYSYTWTNGSTAITIKNLGVNSYTVTVIDSKGCTTSSTAQINDAGAPTLTTSPTNASCGLSNGSVTPTVAGGTPAYTYAWSNGATAATITGLSSGTYTLSVTDSKGCLNIATALVLNYGPPSITSTVTPATCGSANGQISVTLSGGGNTPYTYSWSNGVTSATASGLSSATYTITVTDSKGCVAISTTIVNCVTGFSEVRDGFYFTLSPNPANTSFTLEGKIEKADKLTIDLTDILGQKILLIDDVHETGTYKKQVNIESLPNGIYFLQVHQNNEGYVKKVIKK